MEKEELYKVISNYLPKNKEITNKTYATKLNTLMKSGIVIGNYNDTVLYLQGKYKEKTYKTFITSIIVYLKAMKKDASLYSAELKRVNDKIQKQEEKNEATPAEKANMVSRKDIYKLISGLSEALSITAPTENNYKYFDTYQRYLVLNLYYLIQPLRNDYVDLEVYETSFGVFEDTEKNYIYLSEKKLVLNRYKTSRTYGVRNTIELPEELVNIVRKWMEIRQVIYPELAGKKVLLLTKNLKGMMQVNLTQYLNRIFGKKVSSTMLRKSYLSEKYPVTSSVAEMASDARAMQHSVAVQQTIYRKK